MRWSDEGFVTKQKDFKERVDAVKTGRIQRKGATVLDLFAGLGSSIIALKRLRIKIDKGMYCARASQAVHL